MAKADSRLEYGVARGEAIVGDTFDQVEDAQRHLEWVTGQMESIGLDPDVRLIEREVTTTYGRVRAYREPKPDLPPEDEAPAGELPGAEGLTTEVGPPE